MRCKTGKRCHETKTLAEDAQYRSEAGGDMDFRAYRCRQCGYWHNGHFGTGAVRYRGKKVDRLIALIEEANRK